MPTANWSVISHGGCIIHDIIHINTYIRVSSQPVTCSLYYGRSRHTRIHVHATVYLCILLSCILFQEIQLLFTKVTFCWWHVYFYEHISGVIKFRWSTTGSNWISFITEGFPWKITVNNLEYTEQTTGTTFTLYKKERERRSRPTRTLDFYRATRMHSAHYAYASRHRAVKIGQYLPKLCSNEKGSSFFVTMSSRPKPKWDI